MSAIMEKPQLKKWKAAADHCGVPEGWFRNQTKAGNGPKYLAAKSQGHSVP